MKKEKKYLADKKHVIEIYGNVCPSCGTKKGLSIHHIVRLSDKFEPFGASKNTISNYFPICRKEHDIVEQMIDAGGIRRFREL